MLEYTGFPPQASVEGVPPLSLDSLLIRNSSVCFFVRMQGDAMLGDGIRSGDLLVIEPATHYASGAIVLAFADGQTLVRRYERYSVARGALVPSDPEFPTLQIDEACIIRGQVVASITLLAKPRFPLPPVVS